MHVLDPARRAVLINRASSCNRKRYKCSFCSKGGIVGIADHLRNKHKCNEKTIHPKLKWMLSIKPSKFKRRALPGGAYSNLKRS